ncbi:MAG: hypothetical protein ACHQU0_03050 [Candidatus Paceibacteria bacterium]
MILDKTVETKISNQGKYYASLGYKNTKQGKIIRVLIKHLLPNSQKKLRCKCDDCGSKFERQYQLLLRNNGVHRCYRCDRINVGKTMNLTNTIAASKTRTGENHPRWNPNKSEFKKYLSRVMSVTRKNYIKHKSAINPNDLPRRLCGIEGGYQLDHKVSIKEGFTRGISPEVIGNAENLNMLTWQDNRSKWA